MTIFDCFKDQQIMIKIYFSYSFCKNVIHVFKYNSRISDKFKKNKQNFSVTNKEHVCTMSYPYFISVHLPKPITCINELCYGLASTYTHSVFFFSLNLPLKETLFFTN